MIGGALVVGACLLVLGWTAEIVGIFISEPATVGFPKLQGTWEEVLSKMQKKSATIALAVLSIYAVDFAINAGAVPAWESS